MEKETRRSFLKKTGLGSALAAGPFLNWNQRAMGANERVVLGLIGGRNQGRGDALRAIRRGGAETRRSSIRSIPIWKRRRTRGRKRPRNFAGCWMTRTLMG